MADVCFRPIVGIDPFSSELLPCAPPQSFDDMLAEPESGHRVIPFDDRKGGPRDVVEPVRQPQIVCRRMRHQAQAGQVPAMTCMSPLPGRCHLVRRRRNSSSSQPPTPKPPRINGKVSRMGGRGRKAATFRGFDPRHVTGRVCHCVASDVER